MISNLLFCVPIEERTQTTAMNTMNVKDLCRLCASNVRYTKNILDESNETIFKLIKELIKITINENDYLSTKICLNCEEKLLSFNSFVVECNRVQNNMKNLQHNLFGAMIKDENEMRNLLIDQVKDEVKDELTPDDLVAAIADDFTDFDGTIVGNNNFEEASFNDDEEIPIASLKKRKKHIVKRQSQKLKRVPEKNTEILKDNTLKVKDFVRFDCHVCKKNCWNFYDLKTHCRKLHQTHPYVVCQCGALLKSKTMMYKHIADHKNPHTYCCDKCPTITKTLEALEKHKIRHIKKNNRFFICNECEKIFVTKEALKSHVKSHIPIEKRKQYDCEVCFMKFTSRSSAQAHKRAVHDKIKKYICDLCGFACGTNGELKQHRAIHSDEKPFVCSKCSKSFKTYSNLKTHFDIHEETSYICHVCNRVLNTKRTLKKHLLVHENECRHVCSYCGKAFKRRQTLKVHQATHTGDKPLSCKWCDERFSYASTLRSHKLRHHPDKMAAGKSTQSQYQGYAVTSHVGNEENLKSGENLGFDIFVQVSKLEP